jgi:hypothetical protein
MSELLFQYFTTAFFVKKNLHFFTLFLLGILSQDSVRSKLNNPCLQDKGIREFIKIDCFLSRTASAAMSIQSGNHYIHWILAPVPDSPI